MDIGVCGALGVVAMDRRWSEQEYVTTHPLVVEVPNVLGLQFMRRIVWILKLEVTRLRSKVFSLERLWILN